LLVGRLESGMGLVARPSRVRLIVALVAGLAMVAALLAGTRLGGEMQAGAFLGAGAAALTMLLAVLSYVMRRDEARTAGFGLVYLAWRNAVRNPTRSLLTIGLVAAATFLIGGVSAFRMSPTKRGTGGFDLQAITSRPIFVDLNDPQERESRFGGDAEELAGTHVLAFRWRRGDDASCNNPFRANQPQVLGVTEDVIAYFEGAEVLDFGWAGVASDEPEVQEHPWRLLLPSNESTGEPIPVVLDKNTAMWGLQIYSVGQEFTIDYEETGPLRMRAVGFLDNTVLQGRILMSDEQFRRRFPEQQGESYFLVATGAEDGSEQQSAVRALLEDRLGDVGFSTRPTSAVLSELLAVQNTYLSTFQALGALGLLLGTFGLATVQLRGVLERRRELALMQAIGFARPRLVRLVFWENAWLLVAGLGVGVTSAALVLVPHWWLGDASVPWFDLAGILLLVTAIGLTTGSLATRGMLGLRPHDALSRGS
ncbi:MAG: ABC transporter permease, partial [Planctomycetales bacterium]|nr:ABC transporter permease [Planctomycetales bacterium]